MESSTSASEAYHSVAQSAASIKQALNVASHRRVPSTTTSHPENPIPEEPLQYHGDGHPISGIEELLPSSVESLVTPLQFSSDSEATSSPATDPEFGDVISKSDDGPSDKGSAPDNAPLSPSRKRRASTMLVSNCPEDLRQLFGNNEDGVRMLQKVCCGGGCCTAQSLSQDPSSKGPSITCPDNDAFRSLKLNLRELCLTSELTSSTTLPAKTVSINPLSSAERLSPSEVERHPPSFVTPHPPYSVFSAPLSHARELTKFGAEKRTYHFDLDVTDYPEEGGVDFVVGGAIGVCAPNSNESVDELLDLLCVPRALRDRQIQVKTDSGRWPTIWGDDAPRELITTRRALVMWCSDLQSYAPTKQLFRLMAEYAGDENERKILTYLTCAQGQASFCDLRTGPYITVTQLLHAFPSSKPPLAHLLSILPPLMPRFYSLSNDPIMSCTQKGTDCRRLIEIAVTVHEIPSWQGATRTGVGSGFFERSAKKIIEAEKEGKSSRDLDLRIPMFRGLMANPLAREFVSDGPMLLIGAGVGVAPFRGFVQRRLKNAACANKVWVLQGVRDSLLDELYSGEWGVPEGEVRHVVQSRRGKGKYVQEEVRAQADLVWFVINALDGRVFVCGSSKGMGEGVEMALVDVAMDKGKLNREEAEEFWAGKKEGGQFVVETW